MVWALYGERPNSQQNKSPRWKNYKIGVFMLGEDGNGVLCFIYVEKRREVAFCLGLDISFILRILN